MNPTPAAITTIRTKVSALSGGWAGNADNALLATALNTEQVDNPVAQPTVPRVMYESELAAILSDPTKDSDPTNGSLAKLLNWTNFGLVKADIVANNLVGIALWATELELLGILTSAQKAAVQAYTEPIPDPNWTAQVSWAQANLGRPVDAADIAAARPA
jgi:hypothetical protein